MLLVPTIFANFFASASVTDFFPGITYLWYLTASASRSNSSIVHLHGVLPILIRSIKVYTLREFFVFASRTLEMKSDKFLNSVGLSSLPSSWFFWASINESINNFSALLERFFKNTVRKLYTYIEAIRSEINSHCEIFEFSPFPLSDLCLVRKYLILSHEILRFVYLFFCPIEFSIRSIDLLNPLNSLKWLLIFSRFDSSTIYIFKNRDFVAIFWYAFLAWVLYFCLGLGDSTRF